MCRNQCFNPYMVSLKFRRNFEQNDSQQTYCYRVLTKVFTYALVEYMAVGHAVEGVRRVQNMLGNIFALSNTYNTQCVFSIILYFKHNK